MKASGAGRSFFPSTPILIYLLAFPDSSGAPKPSGPLDSWHLPGSSSLVSVHRSPPQVQTDGLPVYLRGSPQCPPDQMGTQAALGSVSWRNKWVALSSALCAHVSLHSSNTTEQDKCQDQNHRPNRKATSWGGGGPDLVYWVPAGQQH